MKTQLTIIIMIAIIAACEKEENKYEGYFLISEDNIYESLQLDKGYSYYEIRNNYCFDSTIYDIVFSKGIKPYSDSIFSDEGVYYSNGDICMFNNILTFNGTEYVFLETLPEIINFLGSIDTKGDALFVAHLNGYYFKYNDKEFGIKEVKDGYLIYALKIVSICSSVQTNKYLIKIDFNGNIKILFESVFSKLDGCV